MKKTIIILFIFIVSLIVYLVVKNNNKMKVELEKCVDGDTAWFKIDNKIKKYRFLSIDTMENETKFGELTSQYVCNILSNANNIKIEYSDVGEKKDKYNRELVFVFVDNELLQNKLIKEGYAKLRYVYAKYEYLDEFIELEKVAKTKKYGIWKEYNEIKNNNYNILDNPTKKGCRFIGWEYNNKLYDMTTKINDKYNLNAKFAC